MINSRRFRWDGEIRRWRPRSIMDIPLDAGDVVVIPTRLDRRIYPMSIAKDITQILYNVAVTTGVVVGLF